MFQTIKDTHSFNILYTQFSISRTPSPMGHAAGSGNGGRACRAGSPSGKPRGCGPRRAARRGQKVADRWGGDTFHFLVIFKKIVNQLPPPPEGLGRKTLEQVFGRGPAARPPSHTRNTGPRVSQPQCDEPHSLADPSIPQTPRVI